MTSKVLTFYLNEELYGVDINIVKELNRNIDYTKVPDSNDHIKGLFNMRGQIVTVFDLNKILGFEEKTYTKNTCITLKMTSKIINTVGFLIDKTGDVLEIDEEITESPPANIKGIEDKFIKLIAKIEENILIVLDPETIFNPEHFLLDQNNKIN
jgi:purine-binding chemotaxis protein CheW